MSNLSIADANDLFRSAQTEIEIPGKVVMTSTISNLGETEVQAIMAKVQSFNDFTPENDPYGEHDFGSVVHDGEKIFWKIDYYDPSLQYLSEDKTDLEKTVRILTVMFASEY